MSHVCSTTKNVIWLYQVYVDDILAAGKEEDIMIKWFFDKLGERFDCKDDEWLTPETPIDFLGMDITVDGDNVYMSMETYIEKMPNIMGMSESDTLPKDTPEPGLQT